MDVDHNGCIQALSVTSLHIEFILIQRKSNNSFTNGRILRSWQICVCWDPWDIWWLRRPSLKVWFPSLNEPPWSLTKRMTNISKQHVKCFTSINLHSYISLCKQRISHYSKYLHLLSTYTYLFCKVTFFSITQISPRSNLTYTRNQFNIPLFFLFTGFRREVKHEMAESLAWMRSCYCERIQWTICV